MKKILKIFQTICICLFSAILLSIFGIILYYFYSKTQQSGEIAIPHQFLQGEVSITRDKWGVVHINAQKSDLDAWFALGYAHAQDRFWQMEFNRHVEQGTLSELFGPKTLPQDKYLRTWGFYHYAKPTWQYLSPHTKAVLQHYTDGVNLYISQQHYPFQFKLLGIHPKPWTVYDSIAWQKVLAWDLQNVWKSKLNNYLVKKNEGAKKIPVLFPPYPHNAPTILSDQDLKQSGLYTFNTSLSSELNLVNQQDKGSNNWVVSGKWTTTGKPLLANDPHLEMQSPSVWYLAEIKAPGLDVMGATMPGMAGVVIGHNTTIAWGVTNVNPDVQDLYVISPEFNNQINTVQETINIKNQPAVSYPIRYFHEMPIISDVTDTKEISSTVALKWTAFDHEDKTVQSIIDINYAQNWSQFVNALKDFNAPSQNFIYADVLGNIGYYLPGKIPLRKWESDLPVPYDEQHQWQGSIPFEKLPHVYNPIEGMITTANNLPVSKHYPYSINFRWSVPAYRVNRINTLLNYYKPLDIQKFKIIQQDDYSMSWKALSPYLLKTVPVDNNSKIAINLLNTWNGFTDKSSIGQTIFAFWYRELDSLMPEYLRKSNEYPEPLYIQHLLQHNTQKNLDQFLSISLQTAMKKLITQNGQDQHQWQWGKNHRAEFKEMGLGTVPILNTFWNRSIETSGGLYTVNPGTYTQKNFIQDDGASYRQIIDLSQLNNSLFVITLGQSNDPFNANYQDQLPLWESGKYIAMSTESKDWKGRKQLRLHPD
jgi:penicillin amidase